MHSAAKSGKDGSANDGHHHWAIATNKVDDVWRWTPTRGSAAPLALSVDSRRAAFGQETGTIRRVVLSGAREAAPRKSPRTVATLRALNSPGAVTELFLLSYVHRKIFVRPKKLDSRSSGAPDAALCVMGFRAAHRQRVVRTDGENLTGASSRYGCVDRLGFAADPQIRTSQEVAVRPPPIDSADRY